MEAAVGSFVFYNLHGEIHPMVITKVNQDSVDGILLLGEGKDLSIMGSAEGDGDHNWKWSTTLDQRCEICGGRVSGMVVFRLKESNDKTFLEIAIDHRHDNGPFVIGAYPWKE